MQGRPNEGSCSAASLDDPAALSRRSRHMPFRRAAVDEDGHYSFAMALRLDGWFRDRTRRHLALFLDSLLLRVTIVRCRKCRLRAALRRQPIPNWDGRMIPSPQYSFDCEVCHLSVAIQTLGWTVERFQRNDLCRRLPEEGRCCEQ